MNESRYTYELVSFPFSISHGESCQRYGRKYGRGRTERAVEGVQNVQCVAVCCSVLQCVAVRCSVLQCIMAESAVEGVQNVQCVAVRCSVSQCVATRCSVLQCVAVCCSVAVRCSALRQKVQ